MDGTDLAVIRRSGSDDAGEAAPLWLSCTREVVPLQPSDTPDVNSPTLAAWPRPNLESGARRKWDPFFRDDLPGCRIRRPPAEAPVAPSPRFESGSPRDDQVC